MLQGNQEDLVPIVLLQVLLVRKGKKELLVEMEQRVFKDFKDFRDLKEKKDKRELKSLG